MKNWEEKSLGVGRDFQVMLARDSALAKLTPEQRAAGWTAKIKERKDLGAMPRTKRRSGYGRGKSMRRR